MQTKKGEARMFVFRIGVKLRVVSRRGVSKCKRPSRGEQRGLT